MVNVELGGWLATETTTPGATEGTELACHRALPIPFGITAYFSSLVNTIIYTTRSLLPLVFTTNIAAPDDLLIAFVPAEPPIRWGGHHAINQLLG
jgi:hypothetical protein